MHGHPLNTDRLLPWLIEPAEERERPLSALLSYVERDLGSLHELSRRHGGLLFRGFDVRTPGQFEAVVERLIPQRHAYVAGNSPRKEVLDRVYTSTEYPSELDMPLHNELACSHEWPRSIAFFCETAPAARGETPIVDCRRIVRDLEPAVRRMFEDKRVLDRRLRT
jgi:alpha-ketoglutarate-dependent taurine dioxygenase